MRCGNHRQIEIQSKCLELLKITKQFEERNSTVHSLGKVYGAAELHKLPINGVVHDFLIRPRVLNIGTASYHLAKYFAKVLPPLAYLE